jgi:hypothetical protein
VIPNKLLGVLSMAAVPVGLITVPFLESINKFQNPFRRPVATSVFLIGTFYAIWMGIGATMPIDKATDATRLQQLPRAVKHPLVAPEEQRRAALQPRRDRVHGPAILPRVVPHQRLHERRREPRALRRARQASQRRLRVEGPFKATNVGVKFKGVRSGVDRRRGASGL